MGRVAAPVPAASPMTKKSFKRRKKLIKPRLQLKLTLTFVGLSALSLLMQFVLFQNTMTRTAVELPNDSLLLMELSGGVLLRDLAISFLVFLPLTFLVGILTTFRIAGTIYRFERFLQAVRSGERPPNFRLRRGDELQDLAELLNLATEPLRTGREDEKDAQRDLDSVESLVPPERETEHEPSEFSGRS